MVGISSLDKAILYCTLDGQRLAPLCEIKELELLANENQYDDTKIRYFTSFKSQPFSASLPIHFNSNMLLFILSGKKLFLKCPKKIRRSRKWKSTFKALGYHV